MISTSRAAVKSPWLATSLSVVLPLVVAAVLMVLFRDGPPSRLVFSSLLAALVLAPVLLRWQLGWMGVFLFLPWMNFLRRFYLLFDPNIASFSYDLLAILPELIVATTITGFFLTSRAQKRQGLAVNDRALRIPIMLLMALATIEIFNPFMGSVAAGLNGFRVFTLWIFLYFVTQQAISRKDQLYRWIVGTVLLATASGLYGAYQYMVGFPTYDMIWAEAYKVTDQVVGDAMRPFSSFSFCSTFSHYMVVAAILGFVAMRMKRIGLGSKLLMPFFLACILLGLALTFVRSAYMGLIAASVLGLIVAGKPDRRWGRIVGAFLMVGLLVAVVPKGQNEAYQGEATTGDLVTQRVLTLAEPTKAGSMQARFGAWEYVLSSSLEYPVGRGIGLGQAGRFSHHFGAAAEAYTESQYFTILAEMGWPGAVLFMWIVVYGFFLSLRIYDRLRDHDLRQIALGAIMLQVGLSVIGLTGGVVLYTVPGNAYYWAALGLMTVLPRLDEAEAVA